jgi:hypothetical protein
MFIFLHNEACQIIAREDDEWKLRLIIEGGWCLATDEAGRRWW